MTNECTVDRGFRVFAAAVLLAPVAVALSQMITTWPVLLAGTVGAALLATGLTGFCPAYKLLHFSTRHLHAHAE